MGAVASLLLAGLLSALAYVLRALVWVPHRLERRLRRQGIRGPPRSLITGNVADYGALLAAAQSKPLASFHHAIVGRATPHYREWAARYGRPFVFWSGPRPRLVFSSPEVAKAALNDSTGTFDEAGNGGSRNPLARQLIGEGLVGLTGRSGRTTAV
ncbi:cytochrome P450 734A6-like [Aegilops tauschii subsp. strangulata]|uniref:cytochrome P450 734A6-like n=1 Tax=Aegilops tauschii subsp. strangulata TaxID=200361 RepID=UPI003CC899A0